MSSHSHLVTGDGPFTTDQLLVDAERTARQLLTQPHSVHGTTLLAGWDDVLAAAADVLATQPQQTEQTTAQAHPAAARVDAQAAAQQAVELVEQLITEARAVDVAQVPSRLHPDIIRLTHTWQQAAAANRQDPRQHSDTSSQKLVTLRIVRTLAAVAHATQLALGENGPGVAGLGRDEADGFRRLLQRHEQLALRSVHALLGSTAGSPAAPADPPSDAPVGSPIEQLSSCLKQWAPLAIAAAADQNTSARDLRRIAMTEAFITAAAGGLVVAAGRQQQLPIEALPHLQRRLKTATQHWKDTAGHWQWIRRFGSPEATERLHRVSHDLAVAVADVHQREQPGRPPGHTTRPRTGPRTGPTTGLTTRRTGGRTGGRTGVPAADLLPVLRQVTENSVSYRV